MLGLVTEQEDILTPEGMKLLHQNEQRVVYGRQTPTGEETIIEYLQDTDLGNHYHTTFDETFTLVDGHIEVVMIKVEGAHHRVELTLREPGQSIQVPSGWAHVARGTAGSRLHVLKNSPTYEATPWPVPLT